MALGTNYARNSRGKDLMIQAKIAVAGQPPDWDRYFKCIDRIQREFSPAYSTKLIRSIDDYIDAWGIDPNRTMRDRR